MSYVLTAAMVVGGLGLSPLGTVETRAEEALEVQGAQIAPTVKTINRNVGESIAGIKNPRNGDDVNSWTGTTVYYGNKAYYVLDRNGDLNGHSSMDGHMLLFSKGVLEDSGRAFDDTKSDWTTSDI